MWFRAANLLFEIILLLLRKDIFCPFTQKTKSKPKRFICSPWWGRVVGWITTPKTPDPAPWHLWIWPYLKKRVFADEIKDLEMGKLSWIIWAAIKCTTSVLIRERQRETHMWKRRGWCDYRGRHWTDATSRGMRHLEETRTGSSPRTSEDFFDTLTSAYWHWFWTSSTMREYICCFVSPSSWHVGMAAIRNWYRGGLRLISSWFTLTQRGWLFGISELWGGLL